MNQCLVFFSLTFISQFWFFFAKTSFLRHFLSKNPICLLLLRSTVFIIIRFILLFCGSMSTPTQTIITSLLFYVIYRIKWIVFHCLAFHLTIFITRRGLFLWAEVSVKVKQNLIYSKNGRCTYFNIVVNQ